MRRLKKCEGLLLFLVLILYYKLNILNSLFLFVWAQKKKSILRCHLGLWENVTWYIWLCHQLNQQIMKMIVSCSRFQAPCYLKLVDPGRAVYSWSACALYIPLKELISIFMLAQHLCASNDISSLTPPCPRSKTSSHPFSLPSHTIVLFSIQPGTLARILPKW